MNTACEILHGLKECVSMWMKQPMVKWDTFLYQVQASTDKMSCCANLPRNGTRKRSSSTKGLMMAGKYPIALSEMLNRTPLSYVATRDGKPGSSWLCKFWPESNAHQRLERQRGRCVPHVFPRKHLGPLIGSRTWGGLIGISGYPDLIDGAGITAPSFRIYKPDGTWFKEGHGVDPDIGCLKISERWRRYRSAIRAPLPR